MKRAGNLSVLKKLLKVIAKVSFLILVLLLNFTYIVFAQSSDDGVISRPVIEYTSGSLRDPFSNQLQLAKEKEERSAKAPQENIGQDEPIPGLEKLRVQAVIWGGKFPQAIINNKILKVGDLVEGIEIVGIDKKGITLSFAGRMANLANPGDASILGKSNKEEK